MRPPGVVLSNYILDTDIDVLVKMGVTHVRIPFEMDDLDKPHIIKHLKKDIQRFVEYKVGVILSAFGMKYNRDLITTPKGIEWLQQLCHVIKDISPNYVFLQIANEPFLDEPETWSLIQNTLLQNARKILPNHTLITSTPLKFDSSLEGWSMFKAFQAIHPCDDKNIVYAIHFYEPYLFTHQNAVWDRNTRFIKHLIYPTGSENVREVISKLPKNTPLWIVQSLYESWNKNKLQNMLEPVLAWREKYKRPVIVSEFGVYKPHVDSHSRQRWYADVISIFKEKQLFWTFWSYEGEFGLFNIRGGIRNLDMKIAKALEFAVLQDNLGIHKTPEDKNNISKQIVKITKEK